MYLLVAAFHIFIENTKPQLIGVCDGEVGVLNSARPAHTCQVQVFFLVYFQNLSRAAHLGFVRAELSTFSSALTRRAHDCSFHRGYQPANICSFFIARVDVKSRFSFGFFFLWCFTAVKVFLAHVLKLVHEPSQIVLHEDSVTIESEALVEE